MYRPTFLIPWVVFLAGCEIRETPPPQPPPTATGEPIATTPAPTVTATTQVPTSLPTAPPVASTSAPSTSSTSSTPAPPVVLLGEWLSPSCGERKYPRQIAFDDKTGFSASDLVSPCPKGVTCVWSGIIQRRGTWSSDGRRILLTMKDSADKRGAPFPASLDLAPGPTERDPSGAACPYQRAGKASF